MILKTVTKDNVTLLHIQREQPPKEEWNAKSNKAWDGNFDILSNLGNF